MWPVGFKTPIFILDLYENPWFWVRFFMIQVSSYPLRYMVDGAPSGNIIVC